MGFPEGGVDIGVKGNNIEVPLRVKYACRCNIDIMVLSLGKSVGEFSLLGVSHLREHFCTGTV